ncbi:siphovirus ReqiPepy6 Gp37-like family protein [Streptomyces sp. ISL-87]|uniref:siphovirus ReqiPepy6 Gp37-like family protein n=1 Tax=Streptomyces sp. ISL-87 TaxID=2819188 RepID=UPI001BE6BE71|nr:siphovirus ReqiPepy6 Gp37-like family protein [Streptomyces sp. ISL-87]MBT2609891.1 siphovirus ReqiPepy6 Gp37-like family protein [Streptomyces sp. ISL-87]
MGYRVEVFDRNLKRVGEIDQWISLDFTVRLAQEGSWQILIKDGTPQSDLIKKGGGVAIWQEGVSKPLLSGQVDVFQKYWTKVQHTGPGSLYIGGKCHNTLAYRRLAFPDPGRPVGQQYLAPLPVRQWPSSGTAGGMIYEELNRALGPGALADRRIAGLSFTASELGTGMADSLRFDVIGSKLEEWFKGRNIAYRFIYNANAQRVDVEIFKPRDLSKRVRFSPELGNLREYIWTLNAPKATRAIVGAAGEKLERYYYQQTDTASEAEWGRQTEVFVDRRDIQLKVDRNTGQPVKSEDSMTAADVEAAKKAVQEAAIGTLNENQKSGNFQIYPIDTADCLFGRDYFVGDIVTVAVDGTEYSDVVREVAISVDDGGKAKDVNPKIGQQGSGEPLNLYKTVYDMQRKLRKLEARM